MRIGGHIVIDRILEEYGIPKLLDKQFSAKEAGLFQDLVAYSIITKSNAGQYYPEYAYNHPLFDEDMHIYSDSKVSDFLRNMTGEENVGFLNDWNAGCDHR